MAMTKRDASPNLEMAKIEARKEYFMKRLRMNVEKMTALQKTLKNNIRNRVVDDHVETLPAIEGAEYTSMP